MRREREAVPDLSDDCLSVVRLGRVFINSREERKLARLRPHAFGPLPEINSHVQSEPKRDRSSARPAQRQHTAGLICARPSSATHRATRARGVHRPFDRARARLTGSGRDFFE